MTCCACCECCCFINTDGTHAFTFRTLSGDLVDGFWNGSGSEYGYAQCSGGSFVCGVIGPAGLIISFYDGTDLWEALIQGDWDSTPCAEQGGLAGTYTLTNCTTLATDTLTIT